MTYKIIDLVQGSELWLQYRRTKISATDTGVILGLNPWKTPLMLYEEKMGLRELQAVNDKMKEGSLLEEEARHFLNAECGNNFKPVVLESVEYPFMMASLDGYDEERDKIIEIKCGKKSYEQLKEGVIPDYYISQMQKQMFVADVISCMYFCYRSKDEIVSTTVMRDDEFIKNMIEKETEFYRMMMEFQAPPATDRDFIHRDSKEWRLHAEVWKDTKKQLALLVAKEEALRNELIKMCDGQSSQGSGVRISHTKIRGRVNYSNIKELQGVDLEKYRGKNIDTWRFTETKD